MKLSKLRRVPLSLRPYRKRRGLEDTPKRSTRPEISSPVPLNAEDQLKMLHHNVLLQPVKATPSPKRHNAKTHQRLQTDTAFPLALTPTGLSTKSGKDKTPRPARHIDMLEEESILSGNLLDRQTLIQNHKPSTPVYNNPEWLAQLQDIKLVLEEGRRLFSEMKNFGSMSPAHTPCKRKTRECSVSGSSSVSAGQLEVSGAAPQVLDTKGIPRHSPTPKLNFTPIVNLDAVDSARKTKRIRMEDKENRASPVTRRTPRLRREKSRVSLKSPEDKLANLSASFCRWSKERKQLRRQSHEVLESTQIPEASVLEPSPRQAKDLLPPISPLEGLHSPLVPTPAPAMNLKRVAQRNSSTEGGQTRNTPTKRTTKGQVNLSVYINSGLLTVHILEGRQLKCKVGPDCGTFVSLSLEPEATSRPQCYTDTIHDTTEPLYDEKFSFEVVEGDEKRRLLVNLWQSCASNHVQGGATMRLLGCMSFGLHNIQRDATLVSGWYHLLPDHLGRRKHLPVVSRRKAASLSSSSLSTPSLTTSPETPPRSEPPRTHSDSPSVPPPILKSPSVTYRGHQVLLCRGSQGYGFAMTGSCPAMVCRVDPHGPAGLAGIMVGDFVTRINRENVASATSDQLARIIRHCRKRVVMEVHRPMRDSDLITVSSPWKPEFSFYDESSDSSSDEESDMIAYSGGSWGSACQQCRVKSYSAKRVTFTDFLNGGEKL